MAQLLEVYEAVARYPFLLLDTCVLIDEFHRKSRILRRIRPAQRRTSVVALWEFFHGKEGSQLGWDLRRERRDWLRGQGIHGVGFSSGCNRAFESLLYKEEGPPGVADCLLAAQSLSRGWPLVTSNVRHFQNIRGLQLVGV